MKKCKTKGCGHNVAGGKSLKSYAARKLGYCLYCYKGEFSPHESRLPPLRWGSERLLSWSERIELEYNGFNLEAWSPEFRDEMIDYWEACMRGEI